MPRISQTAATARAGKVRLVIGASELGRPLLVYQVGKKEAPLRVMVVAGQHGDERLGRVAALMLLDLAQSELDLSNVSLAVYPNANPDGSASGTRRNAFGIDLNRDHQRLESRENRALHDYVKVFAPHLLVDVHNYPPRRKHLLARDWVLDQDVFLDVPTHPAIRSPLSLAERNTLFAHVQGELAPFGFSSGRYVLPRRSGKVRHSTLDLRDARNGLALRHGVMTVLVEGRQPSKDELGNGRIEALQAQFRALVSVIRWAQTHRDGLASHSTAPELPDVLPVRFRYRPPDEDVEMAVRISSTGRKHRVVVGGYRSRLEITHTIDLPSAYAVPNSNEKATEILRRQGFRFAAPARRQGMIPVEVSVPLASSVVHPSKRTRYALRREERDLGGYTIFPVDQTGGRALALFLEPESPFSLRRYDDLNLVDSRGEFPVFRIPRSTGSWTSSYFTDST